MIIAHVDHGEEHLGVMGGPVEHERYVALLVGQHVIDVHELLEAVFRSVHDPPGDVDVPHVMGRVKCTFVLLVARDGNVELPQLRQVGIIDLDGVCGKEGLRQLLGRRISGIRHLGEIALSSLLDLLELAGTKHREAGDRVCCPAANAPGKAPNPHTRAPRPSSRA